MPPAILASCRALPEPHPTTLQDNPGRKPT